MRKRFETLTAREREVMAGVVAGRLNKQIVGDLGISEITIKVHPGQVIAKDEGLLRSRSGPDGGKVETGGRGPVTTALLLQP